MAPKKKNFSFEEGLERLEGIASQMERGELPLDELLKLYEEGTKLSAELNQKLETAQNRMLEVHSSKDGEIKLEESNVVHQESLLDSLMEQ